MRSTGSTRQVGVPEGNNGSALDIRPKRRIAVGHDLFVVAGERASSQRGNQVEDRVGRRDVPVVDGLDSRRLGFREFPGPASERVASRAQQDMAVLVGPYHPPRGSEAVGEQAPPPPRQNPTDPVSPTPRGPDAPRDIPPNPAARQVQPPPP